MSGRVSVAPTPAVPTAGAGQPCRPRLKRDDLIPLRPRLSGWQPGTAENHAPASARFPVPAVGSRNCQTNSSRRPPRRAGEPEASACRLAHAGRLEENNHANNLLPARPPDSAAPVPFIVPNLPHARAAKPKQSTARDPSIVPRRSGLHRRPSTRVPTVGRSGERSPHCLLPSAFCLPTA